MELLILILFAHVVGDYFLQSSAINNDKATNNSALLIHVIIYFFNMLLFTWLFVYSFETAVIFSAINSLAHLIIDYFSSKVITKLCNDALDVPNKDISLKTISVYWPTLALGVDQFLHQSILIITFFKV